MVTVSARLHTHKVVGKVVVVGGWGGGAPPRVRAGSPAHAAAATPLVMNHSWVVVNH